MITRRYNELNQSSPRIHTSDLVYISLAACLLIVSAWISIPFPVPVTLQTFAVPLTLMTFGGRRGFYAITVYLLMGVTGLPVFSGFQGGVGVLLGPSGGYLMGFFLMALLYRITLPCRKGTRWQMLFLSCIGLILCYGCGTAWYVVNYTSPGSDPWSVLGLCVLPFLLPDLMKLLLAFTVSSRLSRYIQ